MQYFRATYKETFDLSMEKFDENELGIETILWSHTSLYRKFQNERRDTCLGIDGNFTAKKSWIKMQHCYKSSKHSVKNVYFHQSIDTISVNV